MKIFSDKTGPFIAYYKGMLEIEDLNPHVHTRWRMSRWEMIRTGWYFILAGLRGND